MRSIPETFGCKPETPNEWVNRFDVHNCKRSGVSSAERQRVQHLECENLESRFANEILRKISAHSAQADLGRRRH